MIRFSAFFAMAIALAFSGAVFAGGGFSVSSSSSPGMQSQTFANSSGDNYAKVVFADPSVNRVLITGDDGKIYYDRKPEAGDYMYIPQGGYRASAWGSSNVNAAVRFSYCSSSPINATSPSFSGLHPSPKPSQSESSVTEASSVVVGGYGYPYYGYEYDDSRIRPYLPPTDWSSHKTYGTIGKFADPGFNKAGWSSSPSAPSSGIRIQGSYRGGGGRR